MLTTEVIDDGVIALRCLRPDQVGTTYLVWLHDPEVNQYLEVRHALPSGVEDLRAFVETVNASPDSILFGVFLKDGTHIGNIKLGPVNALNRRAEVGLILGDKAQWGKGYATRAILLVSAFAFRTLSLLRLTAGCYDTNQGSLRAFVKAGYSHEGTLADYWQCEGRSVGQILMGLSAGPAVAGQTELNYGHVQALVFVGGGHLMVRTMGAARDRGFQVGALLADRHAGEHMPDGRTLLQALRADGFACEVVQAVQDLQPSQLGRGFEAALALCFGPAWIFPAAVIARFAHGMLNFNGIPIPHYLGGAHYTWQILNRHRQGACHIQRITAKVDRGDLLMSESFELSDLARTPADYFSENDSHGLQFLDRFLGALATQRDFTPRAFSMVDAQRLYFPRLMTRDNGWIDWSWSGEQIHVFCNAFGPPYAGASTHYNGRRLLLTGTAMQPEPAHADFHPYCSGLVVRRIADTLFVAVRGGLLRIDACHFDDGSPLSLVKEGDRLFTDAATLERTRLHRPRLAATAT